MRIRWLQVALGACALGGCMEPRTGPAPEDIFTTIGIVDNAGVSPQSSIPQSSNAIAVKFRGGVPGPGTIVARRVEAPIAVDGDASEWGAIPPSDVPLMGPAAIMGMTREEWLREWRGLAARPPPHDLGIPSVRARAAFDDERIWFLLQWRDETENRDGSPYVYREWTAGEAPSWGIDSRRGEDKAFLSFNVNGSFPEHDTRGCAAACHVDKSMGDFSEAGRALRSKMHTNRAGEVVDGWAWRAAGTDPLGLADDQYWIEGEPVNVSGIRGDCPDPPQCALACRGFVQAVSADPAIPLMDPSCGSAPWLANPLVNGAPRSISPGGVGASVVWLFASADAGAPAAVPYAGAAPPPAGASVPSRLLRLPSARRDDVVAKGRWDPETRTWTVELGRRLVTGDPNDAQFAPVERSEAVAAADDGAPVEPTFSALRDRVLVPQCAGCHGASFPPEISWDGLVGKTSIQGPGGMRYVEPGDPARSWALVRMKALGTAPMPISGPVPARQLEALETWIANGAKND